MVELPNSYPEVSQHPMKGDFVVQCSVNDFAQVACDLIIKQTTSRNSKTKGGMIGFTNKQD